VAGPAAGCSLEIRAGGETAQPDSNIINATAGHRQLRIRIAELSFKDMPVASMELRESIVTSRACVRDRICRHVELKLKRRRGFQDKNVCKAASMLEFWQKKCRESRHFLLLRPD